MGNATYLPCLIAECFVYQVYVAGLSVFFDPTGSTWLRLVYALFTDGSEDRRHSQLGVTVTASQPATSCLFKEETSHPCNPSLSTHVSTWLVYGLVVDDTRQEVSQQPFCNPSPSTERAPRGWSMRWSWTKSMAHNRTVVTASQTN
jgi:hypothetical protein